MWNSGSRAEKASEGARAGRARVWGVSPGPASPEAGGVLGPEGGTRPLLGEPRNRRGRPGPRAGSSFGLWGPGQASRRRCLDPGTPGGQAPSAGLRLGRTATAGPRSRRASPHRTPAGLPPDARLRHGPHAPAPQQDWGPGPGPWLCPPPAQLPNRHRSEQVPDGGSGQEDGCPGARPGARAHPARGDTRAELGDATPPRPCPARPKAAALRPEAEPDS